MTVTIERPVEAPVASDDDVMHIVCHCSKDDITYCGMYLPGPLGPDDDENWCPSCIDIHDSMQEACPWGCRCEECGDSEPTGWDLLLQMYEQISGNQLAG